MTNEQMRRDFEHWFSYEGESSQAVEREGDTYRTGQAAHAWWVWQVATLKERERCALVCERQIRIFLSTRYKTGQPLSSFGERHAAASCAEAIRMPPTGTEGAEL